MNDFRKCLSPGCDKLLDPVARAAGISGSEGFCAECIVLRDERGRTLAEIISAKKEGDRKILAGDVICSECGCRGARPCPGEGQNLCGRCNSRSGLDRWS